ncbi:MAG: hypothetical protein ACRBCJ_03685 [Hyphomicrobiaceae bacterium]
MLTYAVISFAIAAVAGLVLASHVLRGQLAPWPLSILHAVFAAIGLILIGFSVLEGVRDDIAIAMIILLIAALGGFYLASVHLRKEVAPSRVVFMHAGAAVVGFLLLCNAVAQVV